MINIRDPNTDLILNWFPFGNQCIFLDIRPSVVHLLTKIMVCAGYQDPMVNGCVCHEST